jgi:predicted hydrocarbon binding protein
MAMHAFLKRLIANNEVKFDNDGRFTIMKTPAFIFSMNLLTIMQDALLKEKGKEGARIFFDMLRVQSFMGARIMRNRFGFDKKTGLQQQLGHAQLIGIGSLEFVKMDIENDEYIVRSISCFAEEYKKVFGMQKQPVDILLQGGLNGMLQGHTGNDNMLCIETSCIAAGKKYCEFIIKDKSKFDLKDPNVASQIYPELKYDYEKVMHSLGVPTLQGK